MIFGRFDDISFKICILDEAGWVNFIQLPNLKLPFLLFDEGMDLEIGTSLGSC